MLPDGWRRRFERRHATLVLAPTGDEVRISRRDNGRIEELGRISTTLPNIAGRISAILAGLKAGSTRVEVEVPADKLLVKQIQLPLAAEENLRQVLGFEMQRQTPFRAEQVYFNYRVTARRAHSRQLAVQLSVVPRAVVDAVLEPLVDWHLVPEKSDARSDPDSRVFAFVPADAGRRSSSGLYRALLVLNLVLLVAVVAVPLVQQQRYLDQLRARLAEVRVSATTASDLQQRIDQQQARSRYVFAQKAGKPASVELLEELSRRLPDDTWLFRVEARDGKVYLQGTSSRASSLIAVLEDSRFFEDVRFASPVTQDGASGRERFHLSADVVAPATSSLAGSPRGRDS
ncbi:MAG: PilN domain-containing protein [Gammaproteobacteria bacterium]|nr:MAG: PilN domain-containing protein [Gammaproteobacteria bacterium]